MNSLLETRRRKQSLTLLLSVEGFANVPPSPDPVHPQQIFFTASRYHWSGENLVWGFVIWQYCVFLIMAIFAMLVSDVPEHVEFQLKRQKFMTAKVIDQVTDLSKRGGSLNMKRGRSLNVKRGGVGGASSHICHSVKFRRGCTGISSINWYVLRCFGQVYVLLTPPPSPYYSSAKRAKP